MDRTKKDIPTAPNLFSESVLSVEVPTVHKKIVHRDDGQGRFQVPVTSVRGNARQAVSSDHVMLIWGENQRISPRLTVKARWKSLGTFKENQARPRRLIHVTVCYSLEVILATPHPGFNQISSLVANLTLSNQRAIGSPTHPVCQCPRPESAAPTHWHVSFPSAGASS